MRDESNFFSLPGNCKTTVDNDPSSESDCMAPPSGLTLTTLASTADSKCCFFVKKKVLLMFCDVSE